MTDTAPPPLDRDTVRSFVRRHGDGVISTLGPDGAPQSAYLTLAVTERGELVLDAHRTSRKVANLRADGRVSVVVGGPGGVTLQAEGLADIPRGEDGARCAAAYRDAFPQFASSLANPDIVVVRITPTWALLGDYRTGSVVVRETVEGW